LLNGSGAAFGGTLLGNSSGFTVNLTDKLDGTPVGVMHSGGANSPVYGLTGQVLLNALNAFLLTTDGTTVSLYGNGKLLGTAGCVNSSNISYDTSFGRTSLIGATAQAGDYTAPLLWATTWPFGPAALCLLQRLIDHGQPVGDVRTVQEENFELDYVPQLGEVYGLYSRHVTRARQPGTTPRIKLE